MVLPLYLAMTASEMGGTDVLPQRCAWMACQFSPYSQGLTNIPDQLPKDSILILNDRMPCQGHSPDLVAQQLCDAVTRFGCQKVLLDFQQPPNSENTAIASHLIDALPCPVGISEAYAADLSCPVFLSPAPLHTPLSQHLMPWKHREIWLEAALCQETVSVTSSGSVFTAQFPPDGLDDGFWDEPLCCRYRTQILEDEVRFTLYDTPESLKKKLELAKALGVSMAVGLYQELNLGFAS